MSRPETCPTCGSPHYDAVYEGCKRLRAATGHLDPFHARYDAAPPPPPAADAVERARREFYEAAREWFALDYAAKRPPFPNAGQVEWSRVWGNLSDAYVLMLCAEASAGRASSVRSNW